MAELKERLTKSRIKLLKSSPFFGTLLLNAPWRVDDSISTAATDGKGILFNSEWMSKLDDSQVSGVYVHEVLHCALKHVPRMKDVFIHDPVTANIACDIVVNGIIDDNGLSLPNGAVRDNKLKHLSVREIYNILRDKQSKDPNHIKKKYGASVNTCLVNGDPNGDGKNDPNDPSGSGGDTFVDQDGNEVQAPNWKDVLNTAATIAKMKNAGPQGAAMSRIFKELLEPTIDWRTILYKYITESRNDFSGYDRRFSWCNTYLDDFSGSKAHILVYIDVSGSISEKLLTEFMSEVHGAISSINEVTGEVFCFDTVLHPVCPVSEISTSFRLIGGGGTSFAPIIEHIAEYRDSTPEATPSSILPIILTDGYADLNLPYDHSNPLLWCLCPGSVDSDAIPYGDVTRIMA